MWQQLRHEFRVAHFSRKVPMAGTIVDFASHAVGLVIEIDNSQHAAERDNERTRMIESEGYRVVRFWNGDVLRNMPGVCEYIHMILDEVPVVAAPSVQQEPERRRLFLGNIAI